MNALDRCFDLLEYLAERPEGRPLSTIAAELGFPLSATHRLLTDLVGRGLVRQEPLGNHYVLTLKLVSLGLAYLSKAGIVDVAQPLLDQLATTSGELVRLAAVDGDSLTFVAKAQGARSGLVYDPDSGLSVTLSCSAAGHAWLSTLPEEQAIRLIEHQGLGEPEDFGPRAPTTLKAVLAYVRAARRRGFSMINEVFAPGMTAMAAPVVGVGGRTIGVVTIAGPLLRLTPQRMESLGKALIDTANGVARASSASAFFRGRAQLGRA